MMPRNEITYGERVYEESYDPLNNYAIRVPAVTDSLYGIVSNNGDFKNPNYQSFSKVLTFESIGEVVDITPYGSSSLKGVLPASFSGPGMADFSNNAYNQALDRLFAQLRGSLDLTIDGFQARQGKAMVATALRSVLSLKRTLLQIARAPRSSASDLWLQYIYGWRPLAGSLCDLYAEAVRPSRPWVYIKARGSDNEFNIESMPSSMDPNVLDFRNTSINRRCEIVAAFAPKDDVLTQLSRISSLNPISIAYELIPYSFVVDWFIDFGGYMRAYETALLHGNDFVRGYSTEGTKSVFLIETHGNYSPSEGRLISISRKASQICTSKRRSPLGSIPYPRPPSFKMDLGVSRLLSAASLLNQFLPRLR